MQSEQSCRQQKLQIFSEALKVNIIISALFCASTVLLQFSLLHWNVSATVDILKKENACSWNAEIDSNKGPDDTYFIKEYSYSLLFSFCSQSVRCILGCVAAQCSCLCGLDHSDTRLLELIHYSEDFYKCQNLLVFPHAVGFCCGAVYVSSLICLLYWGFILCNTHYARRAVHTTTFTSWVFFIQICCFLFFPFCQILHVPLPTKTFLCHTFNRGEYWVAHHYRCQLQHSHQWYVSIKLSAPLLSSTNELNS